MPRARQRPAVVYHPGQAAQVAVLFKKLQLLLHVRYSAHWLCLFLKYKEVYCSLISFVTLISYLFYNLNQSLRQCAELFRFDDKGRHQIHQLAERTHPDTFLDEAPCLPQWVMHTPARRL